MKLFPNRLPRRQSDSPRLLGRMAIVAMLGFSPPALAEPLTFDGALALALREAPALRANTLQIDAARQAAIPAGELPDPKLALGVDNLPIDGSDRYSLSRDFMTMRRIGLMQEFPNRAKRDARIRQAQARVGMAETATRIARLSVLRDTALAWIARHTAEAQLAHIDALLAENRLFEQAARARLAGGKGAAADAVAPRQEAAEIEARRDALLAGRERAIAQLQRFIGGAAGLPLDGDVPDWPVDRDTLHHGLHRHPVLESFDPKGRVLDAEVAEAKAARRPDWALEVAYQKRGPQFSDMMSFQVRFDLPLWAGSRQEPAIAARQAERLALDDEREAVLREHRAELEADLAELRRLDKAIERQRESLLPLADEKVSLASASWRGGRGSLTDVIAARRERIDTRLMTIALTGERRQMAARLHFAYGDPAGSLAGEQQ